MTDEQTDGRTDRQTYGQTNESDFIGRCPTKYILAFTQKKKSDSNSTKETLGKGVKYVQS